MTNTFGLEWVAAVLDPWAISPHPNFGEDEVGPAAELALVAERRDRDRKDRIRTADGWARELIDSARDSTIDTLQTEASETLWRLAFDVALPLGARFAAAAFAGLAFTEMEQADAAAERLRLLFSEVTEGGPAEHNAQEKVVASALAQHAVARQVDAGQFRQAREMNRAAQAWLPKPHQKWAVSFELSRGVSWKSSQVLDDIAAVLRGRWLGAKAYLEQLEGQTWVKVVRTRSTWIDGRLTSRVAERDQQVLEAVYESRFESTSGKRVLGRVAPSSRGYDALLLCELSGDLGRIRAAREALGRVRMLNAGGSSFEVTEALRLFRQARADSPLKSALRWARNDGPTTAIVANATAILRRTIEGGAVTETDLITLEYAADFLDSQQLQAAIRSCWSYVGSDRLSVRPDWSVQDVAWRTVAVLVIGSGLDDEVASRLMRHVTSGKFSDALEGTLVRVVDALDWGQVDSDTRTRWTDWLAGNKAGEKWRDLPKILAEVLTPQEQQWSAFKGLELAARIADGDFSDLPKRAVESGVDAVVTAMASDAEDAAKGRYAFGGLSSFNVGAALALRTGNPALWQKVAEFALNPVIDGSSKQAGFDRLAGQARGIPKHVVTQISSQWPEILRESKRDPFMGGSELSVFPEALRLGAAIGAVDPMTALSAVMELAAEGDVGRVEAAKSLPYLAGLVDVSSVTVLLLQLSRDPNPTVRAEAANALARLPEGHGTDLVLERVRILLASDGVRTPLRALHGLQEAATSGRSWVLGIRDVAQQLQFDAPARVVRMAAGEFMRLAAATTDGVGEEKALRP